MALTKCPDCERDVSTEAWACPGCGRPIRAPRADQEEADDPPSDIDPPNYSVPLVVRATKSRGVYIILGLFLGCLGIHNFYAGYHGRGAAQLIITLVLGWIIVGLIITGLWALVEIVTVQVDAQGHPMS